MGESERINRQAWGVVFIYIHIIYTCMYKAGHVTRG